MRVLHVSGDGVSNNSPIVASTYVPGVSGSDVNRQRWRLERLPRDDDDLWTYSYRIRHVATGKCLDKVNSGPVTGNNAPIVLYTCGTGKNQRFSTFWREQLAAGTRFFNQQDRNCMVLKGASTANNTAVISYQCNNGWNEYWKLRTGSFDCGIRANDWVGTSQMCIQGSQNFQGMVINSRNYPAELGYLNPSSYPLSNLVQRYGKITPINGQGVESNTSVEIGWQAQRTSSTSPTPTYFAYWVETLGSRQQVYAVPAVDQLGSPNGSTVADGRNHTYMLLGTGAAGQWDVYFDYNRVGATTGQPGGRMRNSETGTRVRYLNAATLADRIEFRSQLMDENGVFRRPYYAETAVGTPKQCLTPAVYNDPTGGLGENSPPYCLDASRTTFQQSGFPLQVDAFTVAKPATTAAANSALAPPKLRVQKQVQHGVDQAALAACMQAEMIDCIETVPGLRDCITARKATCNTVTAAGAAQRRSGPVSVAEVRSRAVSQLRRAGNASQSPGRVVVDNVRTTTVDVLRLELAGFNPIHLAGTEQLYVLSGNDTVMGLASDTGRTYQGWTSAYSARDGSLIYSVLGH